MDAELARKETKKLLARMEELLAGKQQRIKELETAITYARDTLPEEVAGEEDSIALMEVHQALDQVMGFDSRKVCGWCKQETLDSDDVCQNPHCEASPFYLPEQPDVDDDYNSIEPGYTGDGFTEEYDD